MSRHLVANAHLHVANFVVPRTQRGCIPEHFTGLGWEDEDYKLVAGVLYYDYNGRNICADIASEGKNWLSREFLFAIFDYPFNQLKVRRITVTVDSTNLQSQRFVSKLGFVLEATLKEAGMFGDTLIFRMVREECRWLNEGVLHGKKELAAAGA